MLADRYRLLADSEFAGYSPLYERLARALADDDEALALVASLRPAREIPVGQLPVRLFACVHELTLAEPDLELAERYRGAAGGDGTGPDPWPAFRSLLFARPDDLAELLGRRAIQTNEVGRTSALVPALTDVQRRFGERPLSLVEIGPSAGLNLLADRYRVAYSDGRTTGPPDAALTLRCQVLGPTAPPLPTAGVPLDIAARFGIDTAPIDVTDPEACRWLEACVWPDVADRAERLRTAIAIARTEPPTLWRGDALDLLGPTIDQVPADSVAVVVSTWVLAYLAPADRLRVHDQLAELARSRDVALVTAEYPKVTPWVPAPKRAPAVEEGKAATLVGLAAWQDGTETATPLAWMHAHGLWIDWMEHTS